MSHELQFSISQRRFFRSLVIITGVLLVLGVGGQLLRQVVPHGYAVRWINLFHLDAEANIPSIYAALLLLLAAALLALIGRSAQRDALYWKVLATIFAYLSIDEAVGLHELLTRPMQDLTGATGWLHFAWVIPMALVTAVVFLLYLPFLLRLPRRTATAFVIAGVLYVGGAIGLELLSGVLMGPDASTSLAYQLTAAVEETLEFAGVLVFIAALLAYLGDVTDGLQLTLDE